MFKATILKKYLPIGHPKIAIDYMNNWGVDEIMLLDIKNSLTKKNFLINNLKKANQKLSNPLRWRWNRKYKASRKNY